MLAGGCIQPAATDHGTGRLKEQVASLTGQLEQKQQQVEALRRDIGQLRAQIDRRRRVPPAVHDLEFTVHRIDIGWLSGGRGRTDHTGDDQIRLFVFPIDRQGHTVKRLGRIGIRLLDPALPEARQQIGAWKFEPPEAAAKWTSSLVAYGYQFDLKWQSGPPRHPDLYVEVDFTGLDGRRFSASRQFRVKLPTAPTSAPASRPR